MKYSVFWVVFFFFGLLVASSRLGDNRTPAAGSRLARGAVVVHKIKVRIASQDVRQFGADEAMTVRTAPDSRAGEGDGAR
jgi:hypothetical protein